MLQKFVHLGFIKKVLRQVICSLGPSRKSSTTKFVHLGSSRKLVSTYVYMCFIFPPVGSGVLQSVYNQ